MSEEVSHTTGCVLKLILAVIVVAAAILIPRWKPKEDASKAAEPPPAPEHLMEILFYHKPGLPESERMAGVLNDIKGKYGKQVLVTRVDLTVHPEQGAAEKITRPPKLVMMAGQSREYEHSGFMPRDQAEKKIDEILHKLKRVGKDWRPPVSGMQPGTAPPPGAPASPPISPAPRPPAR